MVKYDIGNAATSDYAGAIEEYSAGNKTLDGVQDQEETTYTITKASTYLWYFNNFPELKRAVIMAAIWEVGKSFTADDYTTAQLDGFVGWGKDTIDDIFFNLSMNRRIYGDAFAEIVRDEDGEIINLKVFDPASIQIVVGHDGMIKRYEQISKVKGKLPKKFKPEEIFHLCHNRLGDQIHGISDIESLEDTIKASLERTKNMKRIMKNQAFPFIIWKLKTENMTKIRAFVRVIEEARKLGEDPFIPDDENVATWEQVEISISNIIMEWGRELDQKFFRALGLPVLLFGSSGSTESGSKIEYLAHEQVWEYNQRYIERQVWNQLFLRIDLYPPTTLLDNLQSDEAKDANQGLEIQPSDATAGSGR